MKVVDKIDKKTLTNKKYIYEVVKRFLKKEGIEGSFKIVKDEDIKNGYTVLIKAKDINSFDERLKKFHQLNQNGAKLIEGKHLFYIIQPN